jgi:sugar (pentulose or hexulose) kinase
MSVPVPAWPDPVPTAAVVTRAADGGWLIDCGVSAAGSLLTWLGTITGLAPPELVRRAAHSPPGARGIVALPWLGGARAPWWRDASAAFVGLSAVHNSGDLARAAMESVAWDVARCLAALESRPTSLSLAGAGSDVPLWQCIITAVTGLTGSLRRSAEAASAGAAVLAGRGAEFPLDIDLINPAVAEVRPDPAAAECYERLRPVVDRVAEAVIGLGQ